MGRSCVRSCVVRVYVCLSAANLSYYWTNQPDFFMGGVESAHLKSLQCKYSKCDVGKLCSYPRESLHIHRFLNEGEQCGKPISDGKIFFEADCFHVLKHAWRGSFKVDSVLFYPLSSFSRIFPPVHTTCQHNWGYLYIYIFWGWGWLTTLFPFFSFRRSREKVRLYNNHHLLN